MVEMWKNNSIKKTTKVAGRLTVQLPMAKLICIRPIFDRTDEDRKVGRETCSKGLEKVAKGWNQT